MNQREEREFRVDWFLQKLEEFIETVSRRNCEMPRSVVDAAKDELKDALADILSFTFKE